MPAESVKARASHCSFETKFFISSFFFCTISDRCTSLGGGKRGGERERGGRSAGGGARESGSRATLVYGRYFGLSQRKIPVALSLIGALHFVMRRVNVLFRGTVETGGQCEAARIGRAGEARGGGAAVKGVERTSEPKGIPRASRRLTSPVSANADERMHRLSPRRFTPIA